MSHVPPIFDFVTIYRCPHCPGAPRLFVYKTRFVIRFLKCGRCRYRAKVNLRFRCGPPQPAAQHPPPTLIPPAIPAAGTRP